MLKIFNLFNWNFQMTLKFFILKFEIAGFFDVTFELTFKILKFTVKDAFFIHQIIIRTLKFIVLIRKLIIFKLDFIVKFLFLIRVFLERFVPLPLHFILFNNNVMISFH